MNDSSDIITQIIHATTLPHGLRCEYHGDQLMVRRGDVAIALKPVVITNMTRARLPALILEMRAADRDSILLTRYLNPALAESLEAAQIMFLDAAGNISLNLPNVAIHVTGRPALKNSPVATRGRGGGFKKTAAKVVFALLHQEELVNANYRMLAAAATVSLGSVANVMDQLADQEFLLLDGDHRRLCRLPELINHWVDAYWNYLRPTLGKGSYEPNDADWWKTYDLEEGMLWSGEVAAHKLTKYLKPIHASIYAAKPQLLILHARLRQSPNGPVQILKPFWGDLSIEGPLAPPLLIYAELAGSANNRDLETARVILEEHVLPAFSIR